MKLLTKLRTIVTLMAVGTLVAALAVAFAPVMPTFTVADAGNGAGGAEGGGQPLQFASVLIGVFLGLIVSYVARLNWTDIPRRIVNWVLVRERKIYYGGAIAASLAVILYY